MAPYRILSFDGGGIRGVLSAALIDRLTTHIPEFLESVDLFAGTSTGSFIALGLAHGLTPAQITQLYQTHGKNIFTPEYWAVLRPAYDNDNLKAALHTIFPLDLCLGDLKRHVLIPSFCLGSSRGEHWGPVFLHNFTGSPFLNWSVCDVALASSAAPVFFPSHHQWIDGGVVANNPGTAAIAYARAAGNGDQSVDEIYLLSIGTGRCPTLINADTSSWGALQWMLYSPPVSPLLTILLEGTVEADATLCSQLLGSHYYRLNPTMDRPIPIDAHVEIANLRHRGQVEDLSAVVSWLQVNQWGRQFPGELHNQPNSPADLYQAELH